MKTAKDVGLYIKRLREEKGLTQEQLGEIVGVQKAAVQKWESGTTKNLKRHVVKTLSDYFEVSPASFVIKSEKEGEIEKIVSEATKREDLKIFFTQVAEMSEEDFEKARRVIEALIIEDKKS